MRSALRLPLSQGLGRTAARALAASAPLLFLLTVFFIPSALGHAAFLESTPPAGARLESPPRVITLKYTEPLIEQLTKVTLRSVASGAEVATTLRIVDGRALAVRSQVELAAGAYRVEWHTVSAEDGHALEGSFGFGVRADAVGATQTVQQSPLARAGWVRIGLRALLYGALIFFAGGLLAAALLSRGRSPGDWLVPPGGGPPHLERAAERWWARTVAAGWLAVGAGTGAVMAEAADAASGLTLDGIAEFLFSSLAGVARVVMLAGILAAVLLAGVRRVPAALALSVAFLGVALGGHANSADEPHLAVLTDWVHLLAGSAWLGGIAQAAAAWWRIGRAEPPDLRHRVMRHVLDRFGVIALPAFAIVVMSGLLNALLQLGSLDAAWTTAYGVVLSIKVGLVGLIGVASYLHAMRLRPRLLRAPVSAEAGRLERRHWSLLRAEPMLGVVVVAAAAVLAAFPLPPRQLVEAAQAEAEPPATPPQAQAEAEPPATVCVPCPQRTAAARELPVAEQAGSRIVAAWVRRAPDATTAEVRVLGRNAAPAAVGARVRGGDQRPCGTGCWTVRLTGHPDFLEVEVPERGRHHLARLPIRWRPGGEREARRLLRRAQRAMRSLGSMREHERITGGPGSLAVTRYALLAPNRLKYAVDGGVRAIVVGASAWYRAPELGRWQRRPFGAGMPFRTRTWFRWTPYADRVQLLRRWTGRGGARAEIALYDGATPVWYRLWLDLPSHRVRRVRMIADGHFMTQRYFAFDRPVSIEPPDVRAR